MAGYLFGIAAECAIKAMMLDIGVRPMKKSQRRDDPFYAHFPELRTMLRSMQLGRNARPLMGFIENDSFMNNWSTEMRYSSAQEIQLAWIALWAEAATQAVASIGT